MERVEYKSFLSGVYPYNIMTFSYTGLAYLFTTFALFPLTHRFFQYWKKDKTLLGKLSFYYAALFTLFIIITAIGGLFFAQNTLVLKGVVISAAFLQGLACAVIAYLVFYLKLPQISPWIGFGTVFLLGLVATVLTILIPFYPTLEEGRTINWNV